MGAANGRLPTITGLLAVPELDPRLVELLASAEATHAAFQEAASWVSDPANRDADEALLTYIKALHQVALHLEPEPSL